MRHPLAVLALLAPEAHAGSPVVWRASKVITRTMPLVAGRPLEAYFARVETPAQIFALNPGIASAEKVEDLEDGSSLWKGRTAPIKFGSSVTVTSVMTFRVVHAPPVMSLEVLEVAQESTGPAIFRRLINSMLPKVSSRTSMRQSGNELTSDAHLELELPIPRWLPVPRRQLELAGPPILERQLGDDISTLLDRYALAFAASSAPL